MKVSAKQFKQTCHLLKCELTEEDLAALVRVYGNKQGDIEYLKFVNDTNVLQYHINEPYTGMKSTYRATDTDFTGASSDDLLLKKVKDQVKRDRIRIGEFLKDHDPLRKGLLEATKFRTTLYAQKIQLTTEEYTRLEDLFRDKADSRLIRYADFNKLIEDIFTDKTIEKNPLATLSSYNAPSVLDPKDVLNPEEEKEVHDCLTRIGTIVRQRRIMIKPFFQDVDKSHSGFVATARFRAIFTTLQLLMTDREWILLSKRFQAKAANEINYLEFDHVLKAYC